MLQFYNFINHLNMKIKIFLQINALSLVFMIYSFIILSNEKSIQENLKGRNQKINNLDQLKNKMQAADQNFIISRFQFSESKQKIKQNDFIRKQLKQNGKIRKPLDNIPNSIKLKQMNKSNPIFTSTSSPNFTKRCQLYLQPDLHQVQFSPDHQILLGITSFGQYLFIYNPSTFQLIQKYQLPKGKYTTKFVFFQNDIFVLINLNQILILTKVNRTKLETRCLKVLSNFTNQKCKVDDLKVQTLDQDYMRENSKEEKYYSGKMGKQKQIGRRRDEEKRHLVAWSCNQYEIYYYYPNEYAQAKLQWAYGHQFNFWTYWITQMQFYDEVFLVYGLSDTLTHNPQGTSYIILSNFSNVKALEGPFQIVASMRQFKARSDWNFLLVSYQKRVSVFRHDGDQSDEIQIAFQLISLNSSKIIYDNDRIISLLCQNSQTVDIYWVDNSASGDDPNFTPIFHLQGNQPQNTTINLMALSYSSGQFIADNCKDSNSSNDTRQGQQGCFSYYSICELGYYYTLKFAEIVCLKCGQVNCIKCYNNTCGLCKEGYFLSNNDSKCYRCDFTVPHCISCNSNGTTCTACTNQSNFNPVPVDNKCLCMSGYYLNNTICVECQIAIQFCEQCFQQAQTTKCKLCSKQLHRIANYNFTQCVCQQFYYQSPTDKICSLCDQYRICSACVDQSSCISCNTQNHWNKQPKNSTCYCQLYYQNINNTCILCKITGCDQCSKESYCQSCRQASNFNLTPSNGTCKCIENSFITNQSDISSAFCQCNDGYALKSGACEKISPQSDFPIYLIVGAGAGGLVIIIIVVVCICKKIRKNKEKIKLPQQQQKISIISISEKIASKNQSSYNSILSRQSDKQTNKRDIQQNVSHSQRKLKKHVMAKEYQNILNQNQKDQINGKSKLRFKQQQKQKERQRQQFYTKIDINNLKEPLMAKKKQFKTQQQRNLISNEEDRYQQKKSFKKEQKQIKNRRQPEQIHKNRQQKQFEKKDQKVETKNKSIILMKVKFDEQQKPKKNQIKQKSLIQDDNQKQINDAYLQQYNKRKSKSYISDSFI